MTYKFKIVCQTLIQCLDFNYKQIKDTMQTFMVLSSDDVKRESPSLEKSTLRIVDVCPLKTVLSPLL